MSGLEIAGIVTGSSLAYLLMAGAMIWFIEKDRRWVSVTESLWLGVFWPVTTVFVIPALAYLWLDKRAERKIVR